MKPHALSVVITGGTGPIGAAVARALVLRGARVLLVSRDAQALAKLARELAPPDDQRHRVDALAADVATARGCLAVHGAAIARSANALVNAPGDAAYAAHGTSAPRTAAADAGRDPVGAMQITRVLLPQLLSQPDARVLNIDPSFAGGALVDAEALRACQSAMRGASEALRREVTGGSVRVQFLGRRVHARKFLSRAASAQGGGASPADRPECIAAVAVQMLSAGTRERFVGVRGDMLGRVTAVLAALLDPGPRHRRA